VPASIAKALKSQTSTTFRKNALLDITDGRVRHGPQKLSVRAFIERIILNNTDVCIKQEPQIECASKSIYRSFTISLGPHFQIIN